MICMTHGKIGIVVMNMTFMICVLTGEYSWRRACTHAGVCPLEAVHEASDGVHDSSAFMCSKFPSWHESAVQPYFSSVVYLGVQETGCMR